jgi:hypothetical protein
MRNTPDAIDFIRRAEREGVRAAITARDGPFHDYSLAGLYAAGNSAGGCRRRQVYRTRSVNRRTDRQVACGQWYLVELAAVSG